MRKISILTYWGVANFGAWTQAYALNQYLNQICGNEYCIEHIAYLEQSHWDMYYKFDKKLENAFSYSWNEIPHTELLDGTALEKKKFDILIIGSDAVWELNPAFNDDMHLFGHKIKANKIISYAASFGNILLDNIPQRINEVNLEIFDNISVRDLNSKNIIETITHKKAEIVLDPALLWDFNLDSEIKEPTYREYILVYGAQWTDEFIFNARKYATKEGLKLVSVGYINHWCDVNIRLIELRSKEWIGFFSKAEKVYTSTFHGLMLGINYQKDISFCQVDYVKNRSQTLIEFLDIEKEIKSFESKINYQEVGGYLKKYRNISTDYLRECISMD